MKNNLYYTPTIEEFHIGFQYEYLNENNDWIKCTPTEITELDFKYQTYGLRVKYLDQSDIESLGWEHDQYVPERNICLNFKKPNDWYLNYWFGQIPYVEISRDGYDTGCAMKIKNKSQLKFVMTCLGILE